MTTKLASSTFVNGVKEGAKRAHQFLNKILNDWSLLFAAMLAYNLLIALLPIAVALFGIAGLILRNYPQARQDLKNEIVNAFPSGNSSFAGVGQVISFTDDSRHCRNAFDCRSSISPSVNCRTMRARCCLSVSVWLCSVPLGCSLSLNNVSRSSIEFENEDSFVRIFWPSECSSSFFFSFR